MIVSRDHHLCEDSNPSSCASLSNFVALEVDCTMSYNTLILIRQRWEVRGERAANSHLPGVYLLPFPYSLFCFANVTNSIVVIAGARYRIESSEPWPRWRGEEFGVSVLTMHAVGSQRGGLGGESPFPSWFSRYRCIVHVMLDSTNTKDQWRSSTNYSSKTTTIL